MQLMKEHGQVKTEYLVYISKASRIEHVAIVEATDQVCLLFWLLQFYLQVSSPFGGCI
jgi:hypothetical protein